MLEIGTPERRDRHHGIGGSGRLRFTALPTARWRGSKAYTLSNNLTLADGFHVFSLIKDCPGSSTTFPMS